MRIVDNSVLKRVLENIVEGKLRNCRPKLIRKDSVVEDYKNLIKIIKLDKYAIDFLITNVIKLVENKTLYFVHS